MRILRSNFSKFALIALLASLLAACGGPKKKSQDITESGQVSEDITRPPTVVEVKKQVQAEGNPNETISYDEWRRQRDEERRQNDPE